MSNITKAITGNINSITTARIWGSVFDDIEKAVLADKIACPMTEFSRFEAAYDRRYEESIRQTIDKLSMGLRFKQNQRILETQIEDAAYNFLGRKNCFNEPWLTAFKTDPQAPVQSRHDIGGNKSYFSVHLAFSDDIVEYDRQLKSQFANDFGSSLSDSRLNWHTLVHKEKMSLIRVIFGLETQYPIDQQLNSNSWMEQDIAIGRLGEWNRLWNSLATIGVRYDDPQMVASFLESSDLSETPYIDIYCSITAAKVKFYPDRKPMGSDFYDTPILATVLPYCDIVTTDAFMKEILVNRLQFDTKYKVKVLCAKKEDVYEFQALVRGVFDKM